MDCLVNRMSLTLKLGAKEVEDDVEAACYKGWLLTLV